jgi:Flp pilus assembly protein protease CpaA
MVSVASLAASVVLLAGGSAAAVFDVRSRRIPNALNVTLALCGAGVGFVRFGFHGLWLSFAGLLVALMVMLLPFQARWFGGGDVKLAAALGAWVGPPGALMTVFFGVALGGLLAVVIGALSPADERRKMWLNLKMALLLRTAINPQERPKALKVPLAVPLSLAGCAVWLVQLYGGVK